jgi:hypothetical protein
MAERKGYPQIPSTVWWGVRAILQRTPNATIDERMLGVQLGVQEAAARAYVNELKGVGILTEEGKASPLAHKWRLDDSYSEAVEQLIEAIYPEGLRHVAPPGEADRQKVVSWFQREGLGQGAAGNKAATYLLLSSASPNDAGGKAAAKPKEKSNAAGKPPAASSSNSSTKSRKEPSAVTEPPRTNRAAPEVMPLNVNVQIHISADAGSEQIEAIFSAMRRYLYDTPAT